MVDPKKNAVLWRIAFLAGLLAGGVVLKLLSPQLLQVALVTSWGALL